MRTTNFCDDGVFPDGTPPLPRAWERMCSAERLARRPMRPVAQKTQARLQPTWEDTQSVVRGSVLGQGAASCPPSPLPPPPPPTTLDDAPGGRGPDGTKGRASTGGKEPSGCAGSACFLTVGDQDALEEVVVRGAPLEELGPTAAVGRQAQYGSVALSIEWIAPR